MARPREFDTDEALDKAMNLFWAKGFEATSLQNLVDTLQVKKGSLYAAFGDKAQLYLAALKRYDGLEVAAGIAILDSPGNGADQIRQLLDTVVDAVRRGDRRGCLLCNAAVERLPPGPKLSRHVRASMKRIEAAFGRALDRHAGTNDAAAAQALTSAYMGLRVLAKTGIAADELAATAVRLADSLIQRQS